MKKFAKIIDETTKKVDVGLGDATDFYKSIGMTEMAVEQGYDGQWYLAGFAPVRSEEQVEAEIAVRVRGERDAKIAATDYLAMPDYPLSEEDRAAVTAYRQALRDIPTQEGFPREVVWPEEPKALIRTR